jgi:hypothetical protein
MPLLPLCLQTKPIARALLQKEAPIHAQQAVAQPLNNLKEKYIRDYTPHSETSQKSILLLV